MMMHRLLLIASASIVLVWTLMVTPVAAAEEEELDAVARRVKPAVISISVKVGSLTTQGSGFFISPDGYAVTIAPLISDVGDIQVATDDGKTHAAKIVGTDPRSDLALIKVDGTDLPYIRFAASAPRIGDSVFAVGYPSGLGSTVTVGKVTALGRDLGLGPYDDFIEIDGAMRGGNNGGPTLSIAGEVVGVTAVISNPSRGATGTSFFAIPAPAANAVTAELRVHGSVTRGWIGVQIQSVTWEAADSLGLKSPEGALVAGATSGGPAAAAGIKPGDVVVSLNGEAVKDARDLAKRIGGTTPGTAVNLVVLQDKTEKTVTVTLGRLPPP